MKRYNIILMIAAAIAMVSCAKSDDGGTMPEFEEYILSIEEDLGSVNIRYQRIVNTDVSDVFADIDKQNYVTTFEEYALQPMDVEGSAQLLVAEYSSDELNMPYSYSLDQLVFYTRDESIICYETHVESYTGGAHGGCSLLYECFDMASGALYDLGYLFTDTWGDSIRELVYAKLLDIAPVLLVDSAMELPVSHAILITDTGLTIVYQPYEVAFFDAGILSVDLSDAEIEAAGAPLLWVE